MLLSYKFRLYPNNEQRQAMSHILEVHRQLYNAALQERREAWQKCRISLRYTDQANQLKEMRTFDEDAAWLNYSSIKQTLRRLDKAFRHSSGGSKLARNPAIRALRAKGGSSRFATSTAMASESNVGDSTSRTSGRCAFSSTAQFPTKPRSKWVSSSGISWATGM